MRQAVAFGGVMEEVAGKWLKSFEPMPKQRSSRWFIYPYVKELKNNFYGFLVVFSSREATKYTVEVAISKKKEFPYSRWSDYPRLGMMGFRERARSVNKGMDHASIYQTEKDLSQGLMEAVQTAQASLARFFDNVQDYVTKRYAVWLPEYVGWLDSYHTANVGNERLYPDLLMEEPAKKILLDTLKTRKFDVFMGHHKFRYNEPAWFAAHVYLLARALEEEGLRVEDKLLFDRRAWTGAEERAPLEDALASITGRQPQELTLKFSENEVHRKNELAFLHTFEVMMALFSFEEEKGEVVAEEFQEQDERDVDDILGEVFSSGAYLEEDL